MVKKSYLFISFISLILANLVIADNDSILALTQ